MTGIDFKHSPTPWTVDLADGIIRACDGSEVAASPTPHVMAIDKANLLFIVKVVNEAHELEKQFALGAEGVSE